MGDLIRFPLERRLPDRPPVEATANPLELVPVGEGTSMHIEVTTGIAGVQVIVPNGTYVLHAPDDPPAS